MRLHDGSGDFAAAMEKRRQLTCTTFSFIKGMFGRKFLEGREGVYYNILVV